MKRTIPHPQITDKLRNHFYYYTVTQCSLKTDTSPYSALALVDHLKTLITIEQVLRHYDFFHHLKGSEVRLHGRCPIHHGTRHLEFRVNLKENWWVCLGSCSTGGNLVTLVECVERISTPAAITKLVETFNPSLDILDIKRLCTKASPPTR